jgi:hypothetical protein
MVTLEQVEKLREHANVSYDEAKAALENAGGDILQALIDLERAGKVIPPQGGGHTIPEALRYPSTSTTNKNTTKRIPQKIIQIITKGTDRHSTAICADSSAGWEK